MQTRAPETVMVPYPQNFLPERFHSEKVLCLLFPKLVAAGSSIKGADQASLTDSTLGSFFFILTLSVGCLGVFFSVSKSYFLALSPVIFLKLWHSHRKAALTLVSLPLL